MKSNNSEIAYRYLRQRILSGEFVPGRALMTNLLAPEIGVSRTPIRDALRQLEADGLVSIQARVGASVKEMDLGAFRENCELRLALEAYAAGLAARNRTLDDLREISLALEELQRITTTLAAGAAPRKFLPLLVREDARFHVAVITAARNSLMKKEILRLHLVHRVVAGAMGDARAEYPAQLESAAYRQEILRSHEMIYRAVVRSEPVAAKRTMEAHLRAGLEHSVARLARSRSEEGREPLAAEAVYGL